MANLATPQTPLNIILGGAFFGQTVTPYLISYDTPSTDLVIAGTPGKMVYLVGWEILYGSAYTVQLKSNSTVLVEWQFGAHSGQGEPFFPNNTGIICNTEIGENLILNCNQALPPSRMYIIEM